MSEMVGRNVFITGASRRVGKGIALGLAKRGADVAIHYFSDRKEAEETVAEIQALGRRSFALYADFRDAEIGKRMAEGLANVDFQTNVLINSASTFPEPDLVYAKRNLLSEGEDLWNDALAVNARAPYLLVQALAPVLLSQQDPVVINLVDESVSDPFLDRPTHTVSKVALLQVSQIVARALAGKLRSYALELPPVLPGDGMSAAEIAKKSWSGIEPVTKAVSRLIQDTQLNAEHFLLSDLADF